MKISLRWLKSYLDLKIPKQEIADLLTQRGLEVAHISPVIKGQLEGLLVGRVVSLVQHANADSLKCVGVDVGLDHSLSIVCGAPNVQLGQKVVVAPVGTTIYSYLEQHPLRIKKSKIRGVVSEGMICAEDEIGLGEDHSGIIVLDTTCSPGTPVSACFPEALDDILEIEVTPNRSDACSHIGIARELKAILGLPLVLPSVDECKIADLVCPIQLQAINHRLCPNYLGVYIEHVTPGPSPKWLSRQLASVGIKSVNNVVDVTNFVLHELGQPLHAFDADQIEGQLLKVDVVDPGSSFVGLDGLKRTLSGQELMISDQLGPIAMAGILGNMRTRVTEQTQTLFIEGGYFAPEAVRLAAKKHGIKTEASFRFERGTDPQLPHFALKRVVHLLRKVMPGISVAGWVAHAAEPILERKIQATYAKINQVLATTMNPSIVKKILNQLGFDFIHETTEGFTVRVPSYRVDVQEEVDLIEEVARIYGYDAIEVSSHCSTTYCSAKTQVNSNYSLQQEISQLLVAQGLCEIWTNSLSKQDYYTQFSPTAKEPIAILNPISQSNNVLRKTLLFSGLEVLSRNLSYRCYDVKCFEFGHTYHQNEGKYEEKKRLAIWLTGQIEPLNWVRNLGQVAWPSLRGLVDQISVKLGMADLVYLPERDPYCINGAQLSYQKMNIGNLGQVDPSILAYFEIKQPVFFADLCWTSWLNHLRDGVIYQPIAKFPVVNRSLSLVIDHHVSFQSIKDCIIEKGSRKIQHIQVCDVYEGEHLPDGKKSYTVTFALQDQMGTLNEKVIDKIMRQLIHSLEVSLGAVIRR